jgi:Peptidase family M48
MKYRIALILLVLSLGTFAVAADTTSPQAPDVFAKTIDKITARETENVKIFGKYSPIVETYVQGFKKDKELGRLPVEDSYFFGRASFKSRLQDDSFISEQRPVVTRNILRQIKEITFERRKGWVPLGFTQMTIIDRGHFDRAHYKFVYRQKEFLGSVRCLVFDVIPMVKGHGMFLGRIWVEDQNFNIIRFNGSYVHPEEGSAFLHFDSWRVNVNNGVWLPSFIYSEEYDVMSDKLPVTLRGQTRLWGYATSQSDTAQEFANAFTTIQVDSKDAVSDQVDASTPLASQKAWHREAENNYILRLEQAGLVAPVSPLSEILETVVNNLIVTNNLSIEPEVRCRVLLTAPLESFAIGNTIIVSRGLIDALPDEASLAAVLAHELAHVVLAHDSDNSQFAFNDRLIFPDTAALDRLRMVRTDDEEKEADAKSLEILQNSPYKDKLANMGLFLKQLEENRKVLPNLLKSRLGSSFIESTPRLAAVKSSSPELAPKDIHQVAALPLGSRVILDPWSDHVEMNKARSAPVMAAREKLPFSLTPFYPYLTRNSVEAPATAPTEKPAPATLPKGASQPAAAQQGNSEAQTDNAQSTVVDDAKLDGAK